MTALKLCLWHLLVTPRNRCGTLFKKVCLSPRTVELDFLPFQNGLNIDELLLRCKSVHRWLMTWVRWQLSLPGILLYSSWFIFYFSKYNIHVIVAMIFILFMALFSSLNKTLPGTWWVLCISEPVNGVHDTSCVSLTAISTTTLRPPYSEETKLQGVLMWQWGPVWGAVTITKSLQPKSWICKWKNQLGIPFPVPEPPPVFWFSLLSFQTLRSIKQSCLLRPVWIPDAQNLWQ